MDNKSPRSKEILGPRPTPLKIHKESHKIIKKPPLAPQPRLQPPQLHEQEPSQLLPPRGPVIIYAVSPKIIHTHPNNFMTLVQRLTGKTSTSTIPSSSSPSTLELDYTSASRDTSTVFDASCGSISPAARYAAMEKANASSELGFVGGVETTDQYYQQHHHHQNRAIERAGILSPGPASLPPISPDFFSTVGASDPQGDDYVSRDEDRGILHSVRDTRTIGSAYDRYLQSAQTSSMMPSEEAGRFHGVGMGRRGDELMSGRGGVLSPDFGPNGRDLGFSQHDLVGRPGRELLRLPPDASNTLFVEGLPSNCSRREVSHIFRPFLGYREVRLVTKDAKQRNGDPVVLCFVDFESPACAATARTALQGYRMDENEPDSKNLQIQFSRNPGRRAGQRGGRR
ncbi:unnamed protein product [Eruca vesicaria subsp. sativa]|uniref:RRM domain-containing protein n=1 Tax=Eruca vesicaria subsp. sativa TaxID=29727 RepID=A0ABC8M177_ERUVS|nr:unnamed protein product [Eruca vesicaria subsp. sativa]